MSGIDVLADTKLYGYITPGEAWQRTVLQDCGTPCVVRLTQPASTGHLEKVRVAASCWSVCVWVAPVASRLGGQHGPVLTGHLSGRCFRVIRQ